MIRHKKHLVIPDGQVKDGVPLDHWYWIGLYIAEKLPDVIINIGDFADMPSLSSYDKGKRQFEGRRYSKDVAAVHKALDLLFLGLRTAPEDYNPRLVLTLGNHENRITRAVDSDPMLDGTISINQLKYEEYGWEVVPFLKPIIIDGIAYCHYFPRGPSGKVTQTRSGAPNASTQAKREMMSCTSGHLQGLDVAMYSTGHKIVRGIIAGSCYMHDEEYLGPQGNKHFRGILLKHRVQNGNYDLCEVSLDYLQEKYGHMKPGLVNKTVFTFDNLLPCTIVKSCKKCGHSKYTKRGVTKTGKQRYKCELGHWFLGG